MLSQKFCWLEFNQPIAEKVLKYTNDLGAAPNPVVPSRSMRLCQCSTVYQVPLKSLIQIY